MDGYFKRLFVFGIILLFLGVSVVQSIGISNLPIRNIRKITINYDEIFYNQCSLNFVPGEIIVKLKNDITFSRSSITLLNEKYKVYASEKVFKNTENTILDNIYVLYVPKKTDIPLVVKKYMSSPDIVYAEPNTIGTFFGIPNDENFSKQWYLHNTGQVFLNYEGNNYSGKLDADIDASEAWDMENGSSDVVIAILDSGVDYTHPDLEDNIWNNTDEIPGNGIDDDGNGFIDDIMGWDFSNNDNDPRDDFGHGTMCAGIACGVADNNIGVAGVSWNSKIMPVKWGPTENSSLLAIVRGIKYATDNGADIISMSFGIMSYGSFLLENVIDYAYNRGVFLCAAAGNDNSFMEIPPAGYDNVITVAATNQNDERCSPDDWGISRGSNYGGWVDIAAPGNMIYTTYPTYPCHVIMNDGHSSDSLGIKQNYIYVGGTSASCPIVAGVAALLLSKDPSLKPYEIKSLLCGNVDPYNSRKYIGTGRVNAQKALVALDSGINIEIKGGLVVKAIITNNKTSDLNDIEWEINVKGGILRLINRKTGGTIDIKAGESKEVSTGLILGLGNIVINVRADVSGKAVDGWQFLLFSMVL